MVGTLQIEVFICNCLLCLCKTNTSISLALYAVFTSHRPLVVPMSKRRLRGRVTPPSSQTKDADTPPTALSSGHLVSPAQSSLRTGQQGFLSGARLRALLTVGAQYRACLTVTLVPGGQAPVGVCCITAVLPPTGQGYLLPSARVAAATEPRSLISAWHSTSPATSRDGDVPWGCSLPVSGAGHTGQANM